MAILTLSLHKNHFIRKDEKMKKIKTLIRRNYLSMAILCHGMVLQSNYLIFRVLAQ